MATMKLPLPYRLLYRIDAVTRMHDSIDVQFKLTLLGRLLVAVAAPLARAARWLRRR